MANLCQQCYNENLVAKGAAPLKNWQCEASWKTMESADERMWEYFTSERAKAKKFMKDAEKRKTGRDTRPMAT